MGFREEYEQKLLSNVEEHGWQFTFVFDPDGKEPDFGYTVGFSKTLEAPEFIVCGLPRELMNDMLWEVFRQIQDGVKPVEGMVWQKILEGHECVSRKAVHKDLHTEYTVSADWFWRQSGKPGSPEVFQLVWPGAQQGLFPWEHGCDQAVIKAQPALWVAE